MTKRYLATNSLAGVRRTSLTSVEVTTAGKHNTTYVDGSIKVPTGQELQIVGPFMEGSVALTGAIWLRFDNWIPAAGFTGVQEWVIFYDGALPVYRLVNDATAGGIRMQYWNTIAGTWNFWGAGVWTGLAGNALYELVLKLEPGVGFNLYSATADVLNNGGTTTVNAATQITEIRPGSKWRNADSFYSQIMLADYDMRSAHFDQKVANAEGTYSTDGTGVYTDANEVPLDDLTGIQLPTAAQHRTFTKTAIPAVPVGSVIAGMVINARARIGGTITDGKLLCKQGGSDTLSTGRGYNGGYEPRGAFFATDPATGVAWTEAGFNSAEFGFTAV